MPENKHLKFLLTVAYLALGGAALWLALHFLLPWTLPFLLALLLAALLERPVTFFMDRLRLPRWAAAALCTVLLLLAVGAVLFLCVWRLWYEGSLLLGRLPSLLSALPSLGAPLERWAYRFIIAAPPQMQEPLREALETLAAQSAALPDWLYRTLSTWTVSALAALPDWGLFLFTTGLATYFTSAGRPALLAFRRRQAPPSWRPALRTGCRRFRATAGGWLKAQGMLMLITFGDLTLGFLFLGVDLSILLAALTALVDALPVFGTGTVLIPWALLELLSGRSSMALGLFVLYLIVSLVRSLLEPKLVGNRVGLPPLAALLCMYVGFRAFGVVGMVLSPLAAILIKEAHDCGIVRLWRD